MNFQDRCKKIISENTEEKEKIDGNNDKPNVITEKDPEAKAEDTSKEEDLFAELDQEEDPNTKEDSEEDEAIDEKTDVADEEAEFVKKFIEFTELNCLSKCYNEIFKGFSSVLGSNSKLIKEVLDQHKDENKQRMEELKEELKAQRAEIEERENAYKEDAIRKLSLVSVLDKAIKKEKTKAPVEAETEIDAEVEVDEKEPEEK